MVGNAIFTNRHISTRLKQFFCLLICILFAPLTWGNGFDVTIIKSRNSAIYNTVANGIRAQIDENNPNPAEYNIVDPQAIHNEASKEKIRKSDIIISIGLSATQNALAISKKKPILATLIPRQAFLKLIEQTNRTVEDKQRIGAIYLDPLPDRELALAKYIFGNNKRLSLVTSSPQSPHIAYIKRTSQKDGLNLTIESITKDENLIKKLSSILVSSDVLLAIPDPVIFNRNTARSILLTSYRHRVPVIGYSASYVKAGALAAVHTTPEQIAIQTGEVAINILEGAPTPRLHPKYFSISFNYNVARSLGIKLPDMEAAKQAIIRKTGSKE